jgi:hypothetical protein
MTKHYLAAFLALSAVSAGAQPPPPTAAIQPAPDSAEQRRGLQVLAVCLAEHRRGWARRTLSQPYLSDAQARVASEVLTGRDTCIRARGDTEYTFRTSSMVGSLAEHFLRAEIGRVDPARLSTALNNLTPLNASEDFALCMAARNAAAARDLALSEFGSAAEMESARRVASGLDLCTRQGEQLTVDLQSLRALTSTALYRGVVAALAAQN